MLSIFAKSIRKIGRRQSVNVKPNANRTSSVTRKTSSNRSRASNGSGSVNKPALPLSIIARDRLFNSEFQVVPYRDKIIDLLFDVSLDMPRKYIWISGFKITKSEDLKPSEIKQKESEDSGPSDFHFTEYRDPLYEVFFTQSQIIIKKHKIANSIDGTVPNINLERDQIATYMVKDTTAYTRKLALDRLGNLKDVTFKDNMQKRESTQSFLPFRINTFVNFVDYWGKQDLSKPQRGRGNEAHEKEEEGEKTKQVKQILLAMDSYGKEHNNILVELYKLKKLVGYVKESYIYIIQHNDNTVIIYKYAYKNNPAANNPAANNPAANNPAANNPAANNPAANNKTIKSIVDQTALQNIIDKRDPTIDYTKFKDASDYISESIAQRDMNIKQNKAQQQERERERARERMKTVHNRNYRSSNNLSYMFSSFA